MPLYSQSAARHGVHPIPFPFVIFTFGLVVESIKELGGVSMDVFFLSMANNVSCSKLLRHSTILGP
jgi:hypothetical protein